MSFRMGSPFLFIPRQYALLLYHMGRVAHPASNCYCLVGLRTFPDDLSGPGGPDEGHTNSPNLQLSSTTNRSRGVFSGSQWLCCSGLGSTAHSSRQNLLTFLHVI